MRGLGALITSEARLYLRDPGNIFFVLAFPSVLLIGIAYAIPGAREAMPQAPEGMEGLTPAALFAPISVCVALATAGLAAMPSYLASYREIGVLRRLSTTPMRPQGVLIAQVVVNMVAFSFGALLAILAGSIALDIPMPESPLLALALVLPATTAIFGIGLIIGGLANKASTANGIGMLIYFPMLFFAGLWTPGPAMPEVVAQIATWTPLGAASQAMTEAWFGFDGAFPWQQLASMGIWSIVTFTVAAKTFRWTNR